MDIATKDDTLKYKKQVEQNEILLDIILKQQQQIYNLETELSNANQKTGENTKYKKVIARVNNDYWYY